MSATGVIDDITIRSVPRGWSYSDLATPGDGTVQSIAWAPDGERIAVLSFPPVGPLGGMAGHGILAFLRPNPWRYENTVTELEPAMVSESLAWEPSSRRIAILEPERVAVWDPIMNTQGGTIAENEAVPTSVAWNRDGTLAISYVYPDATAVRLYGTDVGEGYPPRASLVLDPSLDVVSIGWSRDGDQLGAVLSRGDHFELRSWWRPQNALSPDGWSSDKPVSVDLSGSFVADPDLSKAWSSEGLLAVAVQKFANGKDDDEGILTNLVFWAGLGGADALRTIPIPVPQLRLFGCAWSHNDRWVASRGSEEVMLFSHSENTAYRLPSFFSRVDPAAAAGIGDTDTTYFSDLGFTVCLSWSPTDDQLAVGNVGGLRVFDVAALREVAESVRR